jgi:sulfur carrier protein
VSREITIVVNGAVTAVAPGTTVAEVVAAVAPHLSGCAVARNGEVVPKSTWCGVLLHAEDRLEVLTAAQGG